MDPDQESGNSLLSNNLLKGFVNNGNIILWLFINIPGGISSGPADLDSFNFYTIQYFFISNFGIEYNIF